MDSQQIDMRERATASTLPVAALNSNQKGLSRILVLTRYGRLGASSRLRSHQYFPIFEEQGMQVVASPLIHDSMLSHYYATRRRTRFSYFIAVMRRLRALLSSGKFDLLWIEKELFPFLPAWAETWLARSGKRYVVDYDDAIFHNYDQHRSGIVRSVLGKKIATVMQAATLVFVGNSYLHRYAEQSGAKRVELLPTVVDLRKYQIKRFKSGSSFKIGWIGSPDTAKFLQSISDTLRAIRANGASKLVLIGSGPIEVYWIPVED